MEVIANHMYVRALFQGVHVHVERDTNADTNTFYCWNYVYAGSTWLYRWYWNQGYC